MGKEYKVMAITPRKEGPVEECFPFPMATGTKGTGTVGGHGV